MKFLSIATTLMVQFTFMNNVLGHESKNEDKPLKNKDVRRNLESNIFARGQTDGLSDSDKDTMLDKHNEFRSTIAQGNEGSHPSATNMIKMEWSDELATVAQDYADLCIFAHNSDRTNQQETFSYVGENLYASTGDFSADGPVQAWYNEQEDFTYSDLSCSGVCGHYTQVVWANSYALGCKFSVSTNNIMILPSPHINILLTDLIFFLYFTTKLLGGAKRCDSLDMDNGSFWSNGLIVVCVYGPGGNYAGANPYTEGDSSSECPEDFPETEFNTGLCVKEGEGGLINGIMALIFEYLFSFIGL